MKEYADSSFIVSLYANDANHPRAAAYASTWTAAPMLPLTPFGRFELQNTLRRVLVPFQAASIIRNIQADERAGVFQSRPLESYLWMLRADELSRQYVWGTKTRALDVLHVAAALVHGCVVFLTFDANQRAFAKSVGMQTPL